MLVSTVLVLFGLICIVGGIRFHLGYFRVPIVYWTTFSSGIYMFTFWGTGLIFLGISIQLPPPNLLGTIFFILTMLFGLLGLVLGLTMPQFLTPWWFRYLREEYEDQYIFHTLMKEAAKDYSGWKKKTSTMEGLVSWTKEIKEIDEQVTMYL